MSEHRPGRRESLVEEQIREAVERGDFDNLPGKGKPLPGLDGPDDDLWWVKGYIRREGLSGEALLPPSLQLRKEIERLPDTLCELVDEQAVRTVVVDLNRRIAEWMRAPSGPVVPLRRVDVELAVRQWGARSTRAAEPPRSAPPTPEGEQPPPVNPLAAVAEQRRDLADLLDGLTEPQWRAPTLCAGWSVAEVVAHLTMPLRYPTARLVTGILAAGGDRHRMADRVAHRDAASLGRRQLIDSLRDNAMCRRKPPGGDLRAVLSHELVHRLDICVPLGVERPVPANVMRAALDSLNPARLASFGADLTGVELYATDLDWSHGTGARVLGAAGHVLLALCGRSLPPGTLTGAQAHRFLTS